MPESLAVLHRIAAALERMAPPAGQPLDLSGHPFWLWSPAPGGAQPAQRSGALPLRLLLEMDSQKQAFLANLNQFATGKPANNTLLWGARGTGKSALARAACWRVAKDNPALKLIAVAASDCARLGDLFALLPVESQRIVLFLDDLSFEGDPDGLRALKPILDGGLHRRGDNILVVATANRRHLVARDPEENHPRDLMWRDTAEERLALADRFGLWLGFHSLDLDAYLRIVDAYSAALNLPPDGPARAARARAWAMTRAAYSGRTALQFILSEAANAGIDAAALYDS